MNKNLRNLVKRIFYRDFQALAACCAFWTGDEVQVNDMPLWAREEVEAVMRQDGIDGTWRDGFSLILNDEDGHALDDGKDAEYSFQWPPTQPRKSAYSRSP